MGDASAEWVLRGLQLLVLVSVLSWRRAGRLDPALMLWRPRVMRPSMPPET